MFLCECFCKGTEQMLKCSKSLCGSGTDFSLWCVSGAGFSLWCVSGAGFFLFSGSRSRSDLYFDADPDPKIFNKWPKDPPMFHCEPPRLQNEPPWLHCEPPQHQAFDFDADPASIFKCIRRRFPKLMRIRKSCTNWQIPWHSWYKHVAWADSGRVPLRKFMIC